MAETIGSIQVVATINTKDYDAGKKHIEKSNDDLEKSSEKASGGMALKWSSAFKSIAAVAAAAITALSVESIKSFAEYEQLAGGVEKIFDKMDTSKILADADNAFVSMNLSANQYLDTINSLGASFASNMGDEAGYLTAQKGMQAIADFASGTGKSVDILNEKYQMITRSASSYQSIADQFSGVLPATSADFLKQAQAAGLLATKYTQLTDVPIAEYQQAITSMMQKGVSDLGLLGNTAAETAGTISGSFNATKASWDNMMSALAGGDDARFSKTLDNLITSAGSFVNNILKILPNIVNGLSKLASRLISELPKLFNQILPPLIDATVDLFTQLVVMLPSLIPALIDGTLQLLNGIIEAVPIILPPLIDGIIKLFNGVVQIITSPGMISSILIAALQVFMGIVNALPQIIDSLIQALPLLIATIVEFLTDPAVIMQLVKASLLLFGALITATPMILGSLLKAFGTLITELWSRLQSNFTKFGSNFGNAVGDAVKGGINGVLQWINNQINSIINNINGMMKSIDDVLPGDQSGARIPKLNIPMLADGGIVSSPTLAMIGEGRESEAVLPLSKLDKLLNGSGNGVTINQTNNVATELDMDVINRNLTWQLRRA